MAETPGESDPLRAQARAEVEAYRAAAREAGREVGAEALEAMAAAAYQRLRYRSASPTGSATTSSSAPSPASGELRRMFEPAVVERARARLAELTSEGEMSPPATRARCTSCDDAGAVLIAAEQAGDRAIRPSARPGIVVAWCVDCPSEVQRARQLKGLPRADVEACTLERFERRTDAQRQALGAVVLWVARKDARPFLVLSGPPGTGKSHLAKAAAVKLAERGYGVVFTTMAGILDDLKASFDGDDRAESRASAAFLAHVLVLDDLGEERSTDWTAAEVRKLLHARYERRALTLITSNEDLAGLAERQGDPHGRLVSRLGDVDVCAFVRLEGEDYRQRRRAD